MLVVFLLLDDVVLCCKFGEEDGAAKAAKPSDTTDGSKPCLESKLAAAEDEEVFVPFVRRCCFCCFFMVQNMKQFCSLCLREVFVFRVSDHQLNHEQNLENQNIFNLQSQSPS